MYIYVCVYSTIYILYICFFTKKASLLFLWVNTFYMTITTATVYIPNRNVLIIFIRRSFNNQRTRKYATTCSLGLQYCVHMCEPATPSSSDTDAPTHTRGKPWVQQSVSLLCYIHRHMRQESQTDLQNASSILMQQTACFQRLSMGDFSYKKVFKILHWLIPHNVQAFLCVKRGAHTPPNCAYDS